MLKNRHPALNLQMDRHFSYQLSHVPSVSELHDYLLQVVEGHADTLDVLFRDEGLATKYLLSLASPHMIGDAQWRLHKLNGNTPILVWEHASCDPLLVYNLICSTCGQEHQLLKAEGLFATTDYYRGIINRLDDYYVSAKGGPEAQPPKPSPMKSDPPADPAVPQRSKAKVSAKSIDLAAVESIMTYLRHPHTGLFTYPAFLYFFEREYFHALRTNCAVSVLLMELYVDGDFKAAKQDPPTPQQVIEVVRRISQTKRHNDIIAQYEAGGIAFLLPATTTAGAKAFAARVTRLLKATPLPEVNAESRLAVTMGIATIPHDCKALGELLSAAELARDQARQTGLSQVAYADMAQAVDLVNRE